MLWSRSHLSGVLRIIQGLDLFAREDISSLWGRQSQIGTLSLRQGENISSIMPVESDRDYIYLLGRRSLLFMAPWVRQSPDISLWPLVRISMYFLFHLYVVESDRDSISSQERRSLVSSVNRVRQGLDPFARDEISSLQGRQSQIGTRSLCQNRDLFSTRVRWE